MVRYYHSAEMQFVYSTAPADWATGHSLRESYLSAEMLSVYSIVEANWAKAHMLKRCSRCIRQHPPIVLLMLEGFGKYVAQQ